MAQLHSAVIGTGMMGPGIAISMALAGHRATLYGRTEASLARGIAAVRAGLALLVNEEVITHQAADAARAAIRGSTDLADAVGGTEIVFESIAEDLAAKQELLGRVEPLCSAQTILASNTSGIPITEIAAHLEHPERAVTAHFWNPPHLMPLVDIVKGAKTSDETVATVRALMLEIGKKPVVVLKDVPGQLGNRLLHAVNREAFSIVEQGIASAEDVDTAIKYGPGLRFPVYGPLEHTDVVGVDLALAVHTIITPALCSEPRPVALLRDMAARGDLGVKSGRGFYDWSTRDANQVKATRDKFLVDRLKERLRASAPAREEGAER